MYEIVFDYTREDGHEILNAVEIFDGSREELKAYIKGMEKEGCRNITFTEVREEA